MSSPELVEMMAYHNIEPWGSLRDDYRAGLAPAAIINALAKKNAKPVSPLDLYPEADGRRREVDLREMTPAEMRKLAREMARTLAGDTQEE
jgi:hypothetical protein